MELSSQSAALTASWVGGLLLIAAAVLMLWKGRFVIDQETKETTEIELPWGIKFKSGAPVFLVLALGAGLIALPAILPAVAPSAEPEMTYVRVASSLKSGTSRNYIAYAVLKTQPGAGAMQATEMNLPALKNEGYQIYYVPEGTPAVVRGPAFFLDGKTPTHVVTVEVLNEALAGNGQQTAAAVQNITATAHVESGAALTEFRGGLRP